MDIRKPVNLNATFSRRDLAVLFHLTSDKADELISDMRLKIQAGTTIHELNHDYEHLADLLDIESRLVMALLGREFEMNYPEQMEDSQ